MDKVHNVLFETYEDGYSKGLTENYIKVHVKGNRELINQIHQVKLIENSNKIVFGDLVH